jgi:TM2 domain-containing membrane protein YozV
LSNKPKFCSNCGEKLDVDVGVEECPKCHSVLHEHPEHKLSSPSPSVVKQVPYKSPGTTALIAFIGGIFGLSGIGHMYVGKVGRGIGVLILGLVLYALTIVFLFVIPPLGLIFGIGYLIFFIWQIFNARKLARKFNEIINTTGKEPW